jgi:hypothetical protein
MTKWRSNRSISNLVEFNKRPNEQLKLYEFIAADKSAIPPWVKFEFDDKDWAELNRHADLPDDARRELESSIYLYLVFCLRAGITAQQNIKNKFKHVVKKTDELSQALDDLSRRNLTHNMHLGDPILIKHKAAIADLRGWAAQMEEAWGRQPTGPKSRNRDWLIREAAMIYNGYAKTPFNDFPNKEHFIFELLEIAGVNTTQKPPDAGHAAKGRRRDGGRAIELVIRACCRPNWRIFFRRRNSNN